MSKNSNSYLDHFKFYYGYLKWRIPVGLLISIFVGLLDGLGLAMFMPLLQATDMSGGTISSESIGNLRFMLDILSVFGEVTIYTTLIFIFILFTIKGALKFLEGYFNVSVAQLFISKVRYQMVDGLETMKFEHFVQSDVGRLQSSMGGEVVKVSMSYKSFFSTMQNVAVISVYITLAFIANPEFALLVIIGGFLTNLIYRVIYKKTKVLSESITVQGHRFQGLLIQAVAHFKYLKSTGRFDVYGNRMRSSVHLVESYNKRMGHIQAFVTAVREPMVLLIVIIVIIVEMQVFNQAFSFIALSLLFFYRSLNSLMSLQHNWNAFLSVSGSMTNVRAFLSELEEYAEDNSQENEFSFKKQISLHDLSYAYKLNDEGFALKNIHLTIEKNKTVAFVGQSGSGKTTLVNIIAGLLPYQSGSFSIDDKEFNALNKVRYRKKLGYITQEPVIFNDSIYNNVTFWDEKTAGNLDKFWRVMELAAIADYINELPDKEDSMLGNNGINLSGGQKQRMTIARELYNDKEILILDEATSALDSQTELIIQNNIDNLKGKMTILIVAHRLSTIKNADMIVFMKDGRIQEIGSFDEVSSKNLEFSNMVKLQKID
ncbi:MAG: ABC transporter ATP-binding protein [Flavobacteriales bacterium]|nr:ABC transporter ATP-binding protein [Flavobacteriales bacterium]